jgi:hypothetical protein
LEVASILEDTVFHNNECSEGGKKSSIQFTSSKREIHMAENRLLGIKHLKDSNGTVITMRASRLIKLENYDAD